MPAEYARLDPLDQPHEVAAPRMISRRFSSVSGARRTLSYGIVSSFLAVFLFLGLGMYNTVTKEADIDPQSQKSFESDLTGAHAWTCCGGFPATDSPTCSAA